MARRVMMVRRVTKVGLEQITILQNYENYRVLYLVCRFVLSCMTYVMG